MNEALNPQVIRLFFAQALYWSCAMVGITLTALVGLQLAPSHSLSTLPIALTVVGYLLTLQPLARWMQRRGRRAGFQAGAIAGMVAAVLCTAGIYSASFPLLCLGALLLGSYQASAMYYRFAALESVGDTFRGRATATVIGGGVLAALIMPWLGEQARNALATPFAGAYVLLGVLALLGLGVVSGLRDDRPAPGSAPSDSVGVRELLRRPTIRTAMITTAIGHGLMVLVMNATPLAMSFCGFDLNTSGRVIQWHMLGMFLPAFVAGPLVDRLGSRKVAWLGIGFIASSAAIAVNGLSQPHFLISSCLLGIGWNLMLVAGTTLLGSGHAPGERAQAQSLMELGNGSVATVMSFASGAVITGIGWEAVNLSVLPVLALAALAHLGSRRPQPRAQDA